MINVNANAGCVFNCAEDEIETTSEPINDEIGGRYFEDQPDVTDDYQIHVIYSLYANSKDNKGDVNGDWEEWIEIADKYILNATKKSSRSNVGQKFKWDFRKDGKLDVSFLRFPITEKEMNECEYSCGNLFGRTIIEAGFNNPKKIYLNFGDFKYKDWPYSGGYPIFNIFTTNTSARLRPKDFGYFALHEGIHAMGGIFKCSPNHFEGHNTRKTSDLMSREGNGRNHSLDPKNDDYYDHEIEHCPDIKDSVFLTPTSNTPYSPFEVLCLPKEKWEVTNKKLEGDPEGCFYSRNDVNVDWKDSIGIFKD